MQNNEVKNRKKQSDKQNGEKRSETPGNDERKKNEGLKRNTVITADPKIILSFLSLSVSLIMLWALCQQNAKIAEVTEKYEHLHEKTRSILELEEKMFKVSEKLQTSLDNYEGVLSSVKMVTKLKNGITPILNTFMGVQVEQQTSLLHFQRVKHHFQNVTEAWQSRLAAVTDDLSTLKNKSRSVHGRVTEQVNDVERRLRDLNERQQEVEDGTKRNARALDRTEEEDTKRAQDYLDWNTRRVSKLQEQLKLLSKLGVKLQERVEKTIPRAQQWEAQLPAVEESIRSMLRLRAQFSGTERRLEGLASQVQKTEGDMMKAASEILEIRQTFDTLEEDNNHIKFINKIDVQAVKECENVQTLLVNLEESPPLSQLDSLELEVTQLKEGFSSLTRPQQQLQENMTGLAQAVHDIENRTVVISNNVMSKVASIRTDVRRMSGLETEMEALLNQTSILEEKVAQTEKLMIKRIGDLLAGSIDRVSGLRSSTEKNAQRLDQISKLFQELFTANKKLSDRILSLESGQAKLLKMVTFAGDLRPKVLTTRQDFAIIEPKLADLTLRIGQLAEDLMKREEEISQVKERLVNCTNVHPDLSQIQEDLTP